MTYVPPRTRTHVRTSGSVVHFYLYRDGKYAAVHTEEVDITAAMATFINRFDWREYPALINLEYPFT